MLKVNLTFFGSACLKNGCGVEGHGTLKFAISQEWMDELSWFLLADES